MPSDYPEARALALAAVLPAGTDRYIALFDGDPIDGGTELELTDYVRVAHQDWLTTVPSTGTSQRANVGAITFATINEAGQTTHWGIFDAASEGTLLRSGPINNVGGTPVTVPISSGDDLVFSAGDLVITATEV